MQETAFPDIQSTLRGAPLFVAIVASTPVHALFKNCSAYAQDTWRPYARLSATFGARWDYAPVPVSHGINGLQPFAVTGFNNLPTLSLAPAGTPLYRATIDNFAPRVGLAYELRHSSMTESV